MANAALTEPPTFLFTDIEGSTTLWEQAPTAMRSLLATVHGVAGVALRLLRKGGDARLALQQSLEHARVAGDRASEARALMNLGALCNQGGNGQSAHEPLETALAIARELRDAGLESAVLTNLETFLGTPQKLAGEPSAAQAALRATRLGARLRARETATRHAVASLGRSAALDPGAGNSGLSEAVALAIGLGASDAIPKRLP